MNIEQIRQAVADYMSSEGCGCCEDYDDHKKHKEILAKLLNVPTFEDNPGVYDFSRFRSE